MWALDNIQYACIRAIVNTSLYVRRSSWLSPETQPDRVKTYPCRPLLFPSRIFLPRGHDGRRLPLVIRAHGGGWVVNNPSMDDPIACYLADHAQCCVVSIDYGKSPQSKFPGAYEDVVALSLAAIDDSDLPLEHGRVALCGSSAGGNLVLAAAQDRRLSTKIAGAAAMYPAVDLTEDGDTKMARRPDPAIPDFIGDSYAGVKRLYLDSANPPDLQDPRVSPTYFPARSSLPDHVLLIGAEHDMFCHEAEVMASKALGSETRSTTKSGWRAPGVWWHVVYGQPHAFDAFPVKDPVKEQARLAAVDEMYGLLVEWLKQVFDKGDE